MTNPQNDDLGRKLASAWEEALQNYETTLPLKEAAIDGHGDFKAAHEAHEKAAMVLLNTPAKDTLQVAQKVRVACNLFHLEETAPDLAETLIEDLLTIHGAVSDRHLLPKLMA